MVNKCETFKPKKPKQRLNRPAYSHVFECPSALLSSIMQEPAAGLDSKAAFTNETKGKVIA